MRKISLPDGTWKIRIYGDGFDVGETEPERRRRIARIVENDEIPFTVAVDMQKYREYEQKSFCDDYEKFMDIANDLSNQISKVVLGNVSGDVTSIFCRNKDDKRAEEAILDGKINVAVYLFGENAGIDYLYD